MARISTFLALSAIVVTMVPDRAIGQQSPMFMDAGAEARKEQILENLRLEYAGLRDAEMEMGDIIPSDVFGLERGSFTAGGRTYQFLLTADDTQLYILAGDPIDVSRTTQEIAAIMEAEQRDKERKERQRTTSLVGFVEGKPIRGNPDAPVTIVEFSDFQCPYCARAFNTVEEVLAKYPEEVRFVFAHFPLSSHPWAKPASIATECAADQSDEAYWMLHDGYFRNQQGITTNNVVEKGEAFLAAASIDMQAWSQCVEDPSTEAHQSAKQRVEASLKAGVDFGVSGTPAFFVNGRFMSGAQPLSAFDQAIEELLAGGQ